MRCLFKALVATTIHLYKLAAWLLSTDPGGSSTKTEVSHHLFPHTSHDRSWLDIDEFLSDVSAQWSPSMR